MIAHGLAFLAVTGLTREPHKRLFEIRCIRPPGLVFLLSAVSSLSISKYALGIARTAWVAGACLLAVGCTRFDSLEVSPPGSLQTHFVLDVPFLLDTEALTGEGAELVIFDPSPGEADLKLTAYFMDREPQTARLKSRPGASTAWNSGELPANIGDRFALKIESNEPVFAQVTLAWNNTGHQFQSTAETKSPHRQREAATSYASIKSLSRRWYVADGMLISRPGQVWNQESEYAFILNPGDEPAQVDLNMFYSPFTRSSSVTVPPRRLLQLRMDDIAIHNHHYGVSFDSNVPVAVQWRRTVGWYDSTEMMSLWSVPATPLHTPTTDPTPSTDGRGS